MTWGRSAAVAISSNITQKTLRTTCRPTCADSDLLSAASVDEAGVNQPPGFRRGGDDTDASGVGV
jgi:hypothetical protein